MNGISKINRGCPFRQANKVTAGGEAEHLVGIHFHFCMFKKLLRACIKLQQADQFADPPKPFSLARLQRFCLPRLIIPMRCNTALGNIMHFWGAYLNFDFSIHWPQNSGMNRPVTITFWGGNIVFEPAHHHRECLMDKTKSDITGSIIINDNAECHHIRQLFHRNVFRLHFTPDGIGCFQPASNIAFNTAFKYHICQNALDIRNGIFIFRCEKL